MLKANVVHGVLGWPLAAALLASGCLGGSGGGAGDGERVDPDPMDPADPPAPVTAAGVYDVEGAWDVSAPIGGDRTLGVVAAELFVEKVVQISGVPSALEDEAHGALMERVAPAVQAEVDANAPAALAPGSPLLEELGMRAAHVQYASEVDVSTHDGEVAGVERFGRVWVEHGGRVYEAPTEILPPAAAGLSLEADWSGRASGATMTLEPHVVELRYGLLVLWLARDVLEVDTDAIEAQAVAAVGCDAIVDHVTGGGTHLEIDLGVETFRISAADLRDACGDAVVEMESRALGMFAYDTPLELGGGVALLDADGDGLADEMHSAADHGGALHVVSPAPLAPRVAATFTGLRR